MFNPLDALPPGTIIAHRGASAERPENTLEAIRLALDEGAHAVEIDLKRTMDGVVILMHDATVDRTTQGTGLVHRLSYAQVQTLDAARNFRPYPGQHAVPRLEEVLETVQQRAWLNLELTNYPSPFDDLPERVAQVLQSLGYTDRVWVSSFNPVALWRFRRALPQVPTAFLVLPKGWSMVSVFLLARILQVYALHPHRKHLHHPWWRRWQQRGYKVYMYTLNTPEEWREAFRQRLDGLFTDYPARALQLRAQVFSYQGAITLRRG